MVFFSILPNGCTHRADRFRLVGQRPRATGELIGQFSGFLTTNGMIVHWGLRVPRRQRAPPQQPVNLAGRGFGIFRLDQAIAEKNQSGLDENWRSNRGVVGVDTGQVQTVAGVIVPAGSNAAVADIQVYSTALRDWAGFAAEAAVIAAKPDALVEAESKICHPADWEDLAAVRRCWRSWGSALPVAIEHYCGSRVLRAGFGKAVGRRREADRIAAEICARGRSARRGLGSVNPIVFVGAGQGRSAGGPRGGGSLSGDIIRALGRVTVVYKVSEVFTSQRCANCLGFVQDRKSADRPLRVHECSECGAFNRDVISGLLIARIGVSLLSGEPHRPGYLSWGQTKTPVGYDAPGSA